MGRGFYPADLILVGGIEDSFYRILDKNRNNQKGGTMNKFDQDNSDLV